MSTEPLPNADPADVADQNRDVTPPEEDSPDPDSSELPTEADEADALEQQTDVPGYDDED